MTAIPEIRFRRCSQCHRFQEVGVVAAELMACSHCGHSIPPPIFRWKEQSGFPARLERLAFSHQSTSPLLPLEINDSPQGLWENQLVRLNGCLLLVLIGAFLITRLSTEFSDAPRTLDHGHPTTKQMIDTFTGFLKAETVEAKSDFVRDSSKVMPLMRRYYAHTSLVPPWITSYNQNPGTFGARLRTIEDTDVYELVLQPKPGIALTAQFVVEDGKLQLDWESYTGTQRDLAPDTETKIYAGLPEEDIP